MPRRVRTTFAQIQGDFLRNPAHADALPCNACCLLQIVLPARCALPIHTDKFFRAPGSGGCYLRADVGIFFPRSLLGMACLVVAVVVAELSCMLCVLASLPGRQTDSLPFESLLHDTRLEFQCRTGHSS